MIPAHHYKDCAQIKIDIILLIIPISAAKMSIARIRLMSEIKDIERNNQIANGIYIIYDESDIFNWYALVIGPVDSVYEGGLFIFNIKFPETYPHSPPKIEFITPKYCPINSMRMHPNLYACGKVCLSLINTWGSNEWSACYSTITIFSTIQSILDDNPRMHEPPYNKNCKDKDDYAIIARYLSLSTIKWIYNNPLVKDSELYPAIKFYIRKFADDGIYKRSIDILSRYDNKEYRCIHGVYIIKIAECIIPDIDMNDIAEEFKHMNLADIPEIPNDIDNNTICEFLNQKKGEEEESNRELDYDPYEYIYGGDEDENDS